jgi:hypothetical protein
MLPALVWAGACGEPDYRPADLQLDLVGELPLEAEFVRLCVGGVGQRVLGYRLAGSYSYPGLPVGLPVDVDVDVLDADGEVLAQGQAPSLAGYTEGVLSECIGCEPCEATGTAADPEGDSWLLAVRLSD